MKEIGWHIFPDSGLSSSVIPPVFIGLFFSVFFSETLGWAFGGLIVPGYLAPIILVKPISAFIIIVEAFISYFLMRILSDGLSRFKIWSRFFGQDAFLTILMLSIGVKILFEGPLLPLFSAVLSRHLPVAVDFRNELHSIGLVIVPLTANLFWRSGLRRGLIPISINITLTCLFVNYILIPYTNFTISKFELLYESMATAFSESARYYIVLLIGAFLAHRYKEEFGWTTRGILVPALLGIAWFTPLKILTTLIEAALIYIIGRIILNSRPFRAVTMEGPRLLLFFFAIGTALKFILGFYVSFNYPGFKATDLYGFAYILPTLIALEIHRSHSFVRVSRIILHTSFAAAVLGALISFVLSTVLPASWTYGSAGYADRIEYREISDDIYRRIMIDSIRLPGMVGRQESDRLFATEQDSFHSIFHAIHQAMKAPGRHRYALLSDLPKQLENVQYQFLQIRDTAADNTFYLLREAGERPGALHGWGLYLFNPQAENNLVVEFMNPESGKHYLAVALSLFMNLDAAALLIPGTEDISRPDPADILLNRQNAFDLAHREFSRTCDVVQIYGDARRNRLWIEKDNSLLNDEFLKTVIDPLKVNETEKTRYNLYRKNSHKGFYTLEIRNAFEILNRLAMETGRIPAWTFREASLAEYLLKAQDDHIASGIETLNYQPPSLGELFHLDSAVLQPLIRKQKQNVAPDSSFLDVLSFFAEHCGYRTEVIYDPGSTKKYLILIEDTPVKFRGIYAFTLDQANPVMVEIPAPVTELNTLKTGIHLFRLFDACALSVSGTSRRPGSDDFNVIDPANLQTVFQLVHQAVQREYVNFKPVTAVQIRGYSDEERQYHQDILLTTLYDYEETDADNQLAFVRKALSEYGYEADTATPSEQTVELTSLGNAQQHYSETFNMGEFIVIWLSKDFRRLFSNPLLQPIEEKPWSVMNIEYNKAFLHDIINEKLMSTKRRQKLPSLSRKEALESLELDVDFIIGELRQYGKTSNVVHQAAVIQYARDEQYEIEVILDRYSVNEYLIMYAPNRNEAPLYLFSLEPAADDVLFVQPDSDDWRKTVTEFIAGSAAALVAG